MQRTRLNALLILTLVLQPTRANAADVYKCIDSRGHTSYQDMSCGHAEVSEPVEHRYANTLPMPVSPADVKSVERFDAQRRKARQQRIKRLHDRLKALEEKTRRCSTLKASYLDMQTRHSLHRAGNPSAKTNLIRRMREACSN